VIIEERIGALLRARRWTLATAESCTGGLLGHRITSVSGSSAYYLGGFVAYADEVKEAFLGVRRATLLTYGSVSEETAREMARGARQQLGADVAVALTGLAGPTGGTSEKPVGLVYMALSTPDSERCQRHVWQEEPGEGNRRLANKRRSAEAALQMLLCYLEDRSEEKSMVQFIDEPVSVEAQLRPDGTARPLAFVWHGRRFEIESWGRQSTGTRGDHTVHCHLVQTAGFETWELCQDVQTAQWMLTRHWAAKHRSV
jgi:nicotinamide-nucleotide amidase